MAVGEPGELTPDALLHRADVAMYAAKRGGGQRAELWVPALESAAGGVVARPATDDVAVAGPPDPHVDGRRPADVRP